MAMSVGERAYGSLLARRPFYRKPQPGARVNGSHPLAFGMVGCWLFNEGPSKLAFDSVGNPYATGVSVAAHKYNGPFGTAIDSSGGVGPSIVPHNPTIDNIFNTSSRGGTALLWIRPGTGLSVVRKGNAVNAGYDIIDNSTSLRFRQAPSGAFMTTDSVSFTTGQWLQAVCVYNGAATAITAVNFQWYINGVASSGATSDGSGSLGSDAAIDLQIGFQGGQIDHFILWNRALAVPEIVELYGDPMCFMAPMSHKRLLVGAAGTSAVRHRSQVY